MISEVIVFAINMMCITVFTTIIMEAQSKYTIECIFLTVRFRQEDKTITNNLNSAYYTVIEMIRNHMVFFEFQSRASLWEYFLHIVYNNKNKYHILWSVHCQRSLWLLLVQSFL